MMSVTLVPISGFSADESMIIFFVSNLLLVNKVIWTKIITVTFTRDLVRHGTVTLNVTYLISGSSADKLIIIFLFLTYCVDV